MSGHPEPIDLLGAFERTGDGAYAVDYDQKIVFWNRTAERLLGHKATDVVGHKCFEVIAGGDYLGHPFCGSDCAVIECARRGHAPPNYDVRTKSAGGEAKWLNMSIIVLAGRKKRSTLTVHLFRDITEQRKRQLRTPALPEGEPSDGIDNATARLTRREAEVLQHLSAGMTNARVAAVLGVSETTVRNHIEHLLAKLGVHSRLEAVVFAARHRIV
ncbi:MAG: LuxR C-terminal-related transcriptional regulator [Chloroflexota bacterium]